MKKIARYLIWSFIVIQRLGGAAPSYAVEEDERPNFIVIVTDDQRYGTVKRFMPRTWSNIFEQGTYFSRGYVTTPISGPSRASILTGLYASEHGARHNNKAPEGETLGEVLKANGYHTGLVGKYLNGWRGEARPEYDYWVSFARGSIRYRTPKLNVNGVWSRHPGYLTTILGDYAERFIEEATAQPEPFFLYLAFNAPHIPSTPRKADKGRYKRIAKHRPLSFDERDRSDKPNWLRQIPKLNRSKINKIDRARQRELETLLAVDDVLDDLYKSLEARGELDNTVIFFLSDNGLFWGEHALTSKIAAYEEAVRVPYAVRYPSEFPAETNKSVIAANIDIAPTIYDLAGIEHKTSGRSLRRLLRGVEDRDAIYIEGFRKSGPRKPFFGVHAGTSVFIKNKEDIHELYDLILDPYQLYNRAYEPVYAAAVEAFLKRLDQFNPDPFKDLPKRR